MTHVFRHVVDRSALSSRALRPPGQLRISPVDSFEHIGHLRRRDRNDAFRRRGPDELATVEPLRIERNPKAIVPKDLHQIASAAPKNVEIAGSSKSESRTRQRRSELAPPSPRRRSGRARNRAPPSERAQQLPPDQQGREARNLGCFQRFPPPAINRARADIRAPRNVRHDRAWLRDFRQNPRTLPDARSP
jgi:hypothetical protein